MTVEVDTNLGVECEEMKVWGGTVAIGHDLGNHRIAVAVEGVGFGDSVGMTADEALQVVRAIQDAVERSKGATAEDDA